MEKRYLAVDSGGTKVLALLYDQDFNIIAECRTGSMRDNTTSAELIEANIDTLVAELRLGPGGIEQLDCLSGLIASPLKERLHRICRVKEYADLGELEAGLNAAECFGDGLLAVAGTGATLFAQSGGKIFSAGGYGSSVSDEGSGYWIGRCAFGAAIRDDEGRGPRTLLTDLIARRYGCEREELRKAIFRIYENMTVHSPVASVAFCAPLVTQAALQGDEVALDIVKSAGTVLGEQAVSMIRRFDLPDDLPVTVSGSIWRGHRLIFGIFSDILLKQNPQRRILIPAFEPIVGILIWHWRLLHGTFDLAAREQFLKTYQKYRFSVPE